MRRIDSECSLGSNSIAWPRQGRAPAPDFISDLEAVAREVLKMLPSADVTMATKMQVWPATREMCVASGQCRRGRPL